VGQRNGFVNPAGGSAPTTKDSGAVGPGEVRVIAHSTSSSSPPGLSTGLTTRTRSTFSLGQLTYTISGRPSGARAAPIACCAGNVSHELRRNEATISQPYKVIRRACPQMLLLPVVVTRGVQRMLSVSARVSPGETEPVAMTDPMHSVPHVQGV
jgi:hypothetical protein